jgi:hypothetical protein
MVLSLPVGGNGTGYPGAFFEEIQQARTAGGLLTRGVAYLVRMVDFKYEPSRSDHWGLKHFNECSLPVGDSGTGYTLGQF